MCDLELLSKNVGVFLGAGKIDKHRRYFLYLHINFSVLLYLFLHALLFLPCFSQLSVSEEHKKIIFHVLKNPCV